MKKGCLKIRDLRFSYPSWSEAAPEELLSGVSLDVEPGEIIIIFGGAESGKSSLSLLLTGLIPLHTGGEVSGTAEIDGRDIMSTPPAELIEDCGIVFQDPEKQTVTTECFTEAAFALESVGLPPEKIETRVRDAFAKLNITGLLEAGTDETSGGEKKRLALAGLFSLSPSLWLLDESVEELDNPSRLELLRLFRESGRSIIIFTSKYYDAFEDADGFYLLEQGTLSERVRLPFPGKFRTELKNAGIIPGFEKRKRIGTVSGKPLISAKGVSYTYPGSGFELSACDFTLHEGEVISIVGRNGCGKSTFAKLLCGLFEPSGGSIIIGGDPEPAGTAGLNAFCAYMFQNPDYQIFLSSIADELGWGLREAGCAPDLIKARVEAAIDAFRLPSPDTPPALMSFSARKRLQAAVYYLLARPVFILDEADTGMSYNDFIDLSTRNREVSSGMIIITHNLELAAAVSDRVVGMSCGRMYNDILSFSPEELNEWLTESPSSGGPL